jgi:hypothetical protein
MVPFQIGRTLLARTARGKAVRPPSGKLRRIQKIYRVRRNF